MNEKILAKSENCMSRLEAWKKTGGRAPLIIPSIISIGSILGAMFLFFNDVDSDYAFFITMLLISLATIFSVVTCGKGQILNNEIRRIESLCNTELLIVYPDKIFGSTVKGEVTLDYSQIDRVAYNQNSVTTSETFINDTITIYDIVGNSYCFNSFSNVKELAVVIENRLEEVK